MMPEFFHNPEILHPKTSEGIPKNLLKDPDHPAKGIEPVEGGRNPDLPSWDDDEGIASGKGREPGDESFPIMGMMPPEIPNLPEPEIPAWDDSGKSPDEFAQPGRNEYGSDASTSGIESDTIKLGDLDKETHPSETESKESSDSLENDETTEANADVNETRPTGGTYGELKDVWRGKLEEEPPHEIHHMPANDINGLDVNDGPAIVMDKGDHRQTASCGNSLEAREYREKQAALIKEGKFEEAMQMDIDDIHAKFGDKYDDAINQMKEKAREKGLI